MKLACSTLVLLLATALIAETAPTTDANKPASPAPATAAAPTTADAPPSPCRLEARTSHSQTGSECPVGEFVTGIEKTAPMTLRCAVVDVRCDAPTRFLTSDPIVPAPAAAGATGTPGAPGVATPERSVELLPPPPDMDSGNKP